MQKNIIQVTIDAITNMRLLELESLLVKVVKQAFAGGPPKHFTTSDQSVSFEYKGVRYVFTEKEVVINGKLLPGVKPPITPIDYHQKDNEFYPRVWIELIKDSMS